MQGQARRAATMGSWWTGYGETSDGLQRTLSGATGEAHPCGRAQSPATNRAFSLFPGFSRGVLPTPCCRRLIKIKDFFLMEPCGTPQGGFVELAAPTAPVERSRPVLRRAQRTPDLHAGTRVRDAKGKSCRYSRQDRSDSEARNSPTPRTRGGTPGFACPQNGTDYSLILPIQCRKQMSEEAE